VSEWISTKEKLPPFDTEVMIYDGDGIDLAGCTLMDTRPGKRWRKGKVCWFSYAYLTLDGLALSYGEDEVTHWMPLPEVPDNKDETFLIISKEQLDSVKAPTLEERVEVLEKKLDKAIKITNSNFEDIVRDFYE